MTKSVKSANPGIRNRAAVTHLSEAPLPAFARRQKAAALGSQPLPFAAEGIEVGMVLAEYFFLLIHENKASYCSDSQASSTVLAASSGVMAPAARSAETSFTTRPTLAPRNWS